MLLNRTRVVGEPLPRLDGFAKVGGRIIYGADFALPGMLHGKVLRSPHPHAQILRIDTSKALAVAGVVKILTGDDINPVRFGVAVKDATVLAVGRVLYVGQPVALVAAVSRKAAERALELIHIDYREIEPIFDLEAAIVPGAREIHPDWRSHEHAPAYRPRGQNVANRAVMRHGDIAASFEGAHRVYRHRFKTSMVHAGYMEPRAATAAWSDDDALTVWSNVQTPYETQNTLSEILEIPVSQVRVVIPAIGGGFGGKLRIGVDHYAAILARACGRPVKIVTTTEEEMIAAHPRQATIIDLDTAVDDQGIILGRKARVLLDCGAGAGSGPGTAAVALNILIGPYRTPAFHMEGIAVYTNKVPSGSFRSPSGPMANFATESQMDMIARDLAIDPIELRLRNLVREGDTGPSGEKLTSVSIEECLRKAAEAIGWSGGREEPGRGKGIACSWWVVASAGPSVVIVRIGPDGKVLLNSGAVEIGTAALTGAAQILAEELSVDLEDISVATVDTQVSPYDFGAQGSRTMFSVGNACRDAAAKLREQIFAAAARQFGVPAETLRLRNKLVYAGDRSVSIAELAQAAQFDMGGMVATGNSRPPLPEYDPSRFECHPMPIWIGASYHAHAVDLSVDDMTGEITINRYVAVQDVGYAINPMFIRGQIEGGVAQGLGQALFEEIVVEAGHVLNSNLTDYKMPTSMDVPEIESILVESGSELGPYGAKGVGEPPIVMPPAAVANAVASAAGIWVTSLPITAEKIALGRTGARNDAVADFGDCRTGPHRLSENGRSTVERNS